MYKKRVNQLSCLGHVDFCATDGTPNWVLHVNYGVGWLSTFVGNDTLFWVESDVVFCVKFTASIVKNMAPQFSVLYLYDTNMISVEIFDYDDKQALRHDVCWWWWWWW